MGFICIYGSCKNHSRSQSWDVINKKVFFIRLPTLKKDPVKLKKWIQIISRKDITIDSVKRYHRVCSIHFVGGNGPTVENPDPLPDPNSIILERSKQHGNANGHSYELCSQTKNIEESDISLSRSFPVYENVDINREMLQSRPSESNKNLFNNLGNCAAGDGVIPDQFEKSSLEISSVFSLNESALSSFPTPNTGVSVQNLSYIINFPATSSKVEELTRNFLIYQASNLRKMAWCLDINTSINFNDVNTSIAFNKSLNEKLFLKIEVSSSMNVTIRPLGKKLPEQHKILSSPDLKLNEPISLLDDLLKIMTEVDLWNTCPGISGERLSKDAFLKTSYYCQNSHSVRSNKCLLLFKSKFTNLCLQCRLSKLNIVRRLNRNKLISSSKTPSDVKVGSNVRCLRKEALRIQMVKLKNKALKKEIKTTEGKIRKSIFKNGLLLSEEDSADFETILKENPFNDPTNIQKHLVKEQLKLIKTKISRPRIWHPAIIQWCLHIRAKSPTTYDTSKKMLTLPSRRTLFNYTRDLIEKPGFNEESLIEIRINFSPEEKKEHEQYFSLILDKISIKEDLVFHSDTGELVGFVNFSNNIIESEVESTDSCSPLASCNQILQVAVRGITTDFKFLYAFFPCSELKSEHSFFSMIWEAIEYLTGAGYKILTVICDKTLINQKLISDSTADQKELFDDKVGYRGLNVFNNLEPIFFMFDVGHLIKVTRNCLESSGKMKEMKDGTLKPIKLLKKDGKLILWRHFYNTFQIDNKSILRKVPKLTFSHVNLTPFSRKRVKFATETLSSSVSFAMKELNGDDTLETVKLIDYFDKFFDILNISNLTVGVEFKKPALEPFRSLNDTRFEWLENEFLKYLSDWENEINKMEPVGDMEKHSVMILSKDVLTAIRITVYSTIKAVKFLLKKGAPFVLTRKFNYDLLEGKEEIRKPK